MSIPILTIPTLTTERLQLEPLATGHTRGMFELWSCPEVVLYSGLAYDKNGNTIQLPAKCRRDSDKLIDFWRNARKDGWGFRWAIIMLDSRDFVGTVGFNSLESCSEIAYHLHPDYWGRGLMTEASRAAIQWRVNEGSCVEFEAFIEPGNAASVALATRLGFTRTQEVSDGAVRYRNPTIPP